MSHHSLQRRLSRQLSGALLVAMCVGVSSQALAQESDKAMSNVANLSAEGTVEVQQDQMRMVLSTSKQGKDAATVQNQLRQALDAALQAVKPMASTNAMEVQTGSFSLYPNRDRDGRITLWQGSAELILLGKDMPRISQAASRVTTMTIADISYDVSRELRNQTENEAQAVAIRNFKNKAQTISQAFGFGGYAIRNVSLDNHGGFGAPRMAMMASARMMKAEDNAPVAVEPGKATVRVLVQGSVQMR